MSRTPFALALSTLLLPAMAFGAPTVHHRSIGPAPDYNAGTVAVLNGETHVIGSSGVQWRTANRGQGDRISISGTDYTILSVDAQNELTLTEPYMGVTDSAATYNIARKFTTLRDWEDCIEAAVACPGVTSSTMSVDERIEVGVVYDDGAPYLMNDSGERLVLDTVISDAVHTVTLTVTPPNRHHGVENTGVVLDNSDKDSPAILAQTNFLTVEWIEIHDGDAGDQIEISSIGLSNQIVVRNVIFRDDDNSAHGLHVNVEWANVLFYNNLLYGLSNGVHMNGITAGASGAFELFHNTFFGNMKGINATTSLAAENDVIFLNGNLSMSNALADYDAPNPHPSSSNNFSEDTTAMFPWGFGNTLISSVEFLSTVAPLDLHIRRTSAMRDLGAPLAQVTDDLDGGPRGLPDIGADEADTSSARPVKILTAKSASSHVQLEWQHPDFGPMNFVEIVRSPTGFPLTPSDGTTVCTFGGPAPFTKSQCADTLPLTDGNTYYYSAFVHDFSLNFSKDESVLGEPFDTGATPPDWTYATKGATLEPAGVRGANAFVVSNDDFFHALQGGAVPTSGEWPAGAWAPYELPATVQHRPVIVDVLGAPTALLGAQDGRVYAVRVDNGRVVWKSEVLGAGINAAPAALVAAFGASGGGADHVFVGTSDLSSNSLHVLDLQTGEHVGFFDDGGLPANIGAVTGVAVKYPSGPVYFTSDDGAGASPRNIWSINVANPLLPSENWSHRPGPIDAGPTLYRGKLFIGSRAGELIAYFEGGTIPLWNVPYGDGPVKAPIFPVWPNDTLVFTTDSELHSVQFEATGGCVTPPCAAWTVPLGVIASPVLVVPASDQAFVGLANGDLRELTLDVVTPVNPPLLNRAFTLTTSALGGPAFSPSQDTLYVSDSSGKVHGIPWPIP